MATISAKPYAVMIKSGAEIHGNGGERLRLLAVVLFDEEDEPLFVGLIRVEGA